MKHLVEKCVLSIPKGLMSLVITAVIVYLSLADNPLNLNNVHFFRGFDKLSHVVMYFLCAVAYILDFAKIRFPHKTRMGQEIALMSCAIILGGLMEVAQLVMENGRTYDPFDWVADSVGATLGFFFLNLWYLHRLRKYYYGYLYHSHKHHHHHKKS